MLAQLRKHLQTWLNVPLLPPDQTDQIQTLQDRMDSLEQIIMIANADTPSSLPADRQMADLPDAHLGAH